MSVLRSDEWYNWQWKPNCILLKLLIEQFGGFCFVIKRSKINNFAVCTFKMSLSALWALPARVLRVCLLGRFQWGDLSLFLGRGCSNTSLLHPSPFSWGWVSNCFLLPGLGNSYPSAGKHYLNCLGVLHLPLKIRNFVGISSADWVCVFQCGIEFSCVMGQNVIKSNTFAWRGFQFYMNP